MEKSDKSEKQKKNKKSKAKKVNYPIDQNNKIKSRSSTISNAFVHAIIPTIIPEDEELEEIFKILSIDVENITCVYCGKEASSWDHFRPLVDNKEATGYITEIYNMVPACNTCNSSKGNQDWDKWIDGNSKRARNIENKDKHKEKIKNFVKYSNCKVSNVKEIINTHNEISNKIIEYNKMRDEIINKLEEAQKKANEIKRLII